MEGVGEVASYLGHSSLHLTAFLYSLSKAERWYWYDVLAMERGEGGL